LRNVSRSRQQEGLPVSKKAKSYRDIKPIKSISVDLTTIYKSSIHCFGDSNKASIDTNNPTNHDGILKTDSCLYADEMIAIHSSQRSKIEVNYFSLTAAMLFALLINQPATAI